MTSKIAKKLRSPKFHVLKKKNRKLHGNTGNFLSLRQQQFDIVVSNPPYVRELEKAHMSRNVLEHEPSTALFVSDEDPLIYYQKIAELFVLQQHKGAALFFEINEFLSEQLRALLYEMGFNTIELKEDFRGKKRMLKVQF